MSIKKSRNQILTDMYQPYIYNTTASILCGKLDVELCPEIVRARNKKKSIRLRQDDVY